MKIPLHRRTFAAFTLIELVAVVFLLGVMVLLLIPRSHGCRAQKIACVNNLKQIGLGFKIFANDHEDRYPMKVPWAEGGAKEAAEFGIGWGQLLVMSNELSTPKILICPEDLLTTTALTNWAFLYTQRQSYFVGLDAADANPQLLLAGDWNITNGVGRTGRVLVLGTNQPIGYTREVHQHSGNVVLADGSVQQLTGSRLREQVRDSGVDQRLAMP